jgi:hypothetical protein
VGIYENDLKRHLGEFLRSMGFPELVDVNDKLAVKKYIKESIIDRVIYKDLQELFNIRDLPSLKNLLDIFVDAPGQMAELDTLSGELGITRQTLSSYISYLEDSFLLKRLYNFSRNRRAMGRKLRKYYPTIISPDLLFRQDNLSQSTVFEWAMVNQLDAEFFWRDQYKNEVDIVTNEGVPIEVKYGRISTKGMMAFMKKFNVKNGYILSSEREETVKEKGRVIEVVPAFKFLLRSPVKSN